MISSRLLMISALCRLCSVPVSGFDGDDSADFVTVRRQLDAKLRAIMGWPPLDSPTPPGVRGTPDAVTEGRPPWPTKSSDPFSADRSVFDAENECVSANKGRPCVCRVADFLDLVGRRLDDETAAAASETSLECPSYSVIPVAFVLAPAAHQTDAAGDGDDETKTVDVANNNGTTVDVADKIRAVSVDGVGTAPVWKEVDFDYVINYELVKSDNDYYVVQYGLVGSDVKIQCLIDDNNGTKISAYIWEFKMSKHKTDNKIIGMDTSNLLITGLEARDSKNYTCIPTIDVAGNFKYIRPYTHFVIAVENPIYEIRGAAIYNTSSGGGCTPSLINLIQKQLPGIMRRELCPEGSSLYACNVLVEVPECNEYQKTLEIDYSVTLNYNANKINRIRTSKKGHNALLYQKLIARISNVLAANLNKTLMVQILSKTSFNETNFKPDYDQTRIEKLVTCPPGFGIREVFCGACPPHHYSPDKSTDCLVCREGYYQTLAGSDNCIKYKEQVPPYFYYVTGLICLTFYLIIIGICVCCCHEENEEEIRIIPRRLTETFKIPKGFTLLYHQNMDGSNITKKQLKKLKKSSKESNSKISNQEKLFLNEKYHRISEY